MSRFLKSVVVVVLSIGAVFGTLALTASSPTGIDVGQMAPEIVMKDQNGKEFKLSSLRGKVVLVDFWATWCGPCRRVMPEMKTIFKKYKDGKFAMLGVSLDRDLTAWKDYIVKQELPWLHVADGNFWQNKAAQDYGIQAIPSVWVIGADGKIVAKGLYGEAEIETALAKALGTSKK